MVSVMNNTHQIGMLLLIHSVLVAIIKLGMPRFVTGSRWTWALKLLLLGYIVQLSGVVHELGHGNMTSIGGEVAVPNLYYVPYVGFAKATEVHTDMDMARYRESTAGQRLHVGQRGFQAHAVYLVLMAVLLFGANPWIIATVLGGMLVYMNVYPWIVPSLSSDFKWW